MQIETIEGIRVLRPAEGLKITNRARDFYSEEVWLGKEDDPENYIEIEEGEEIL